MQMLWSTPLVSVLRRFDCSLEMARQGGKINGLVYIYMKSKICLSRNDLSSRSKLLG